MFGRIGITEQSDPVFDLKWLPWVKSGKPAILISKDPSKLFNMVCDLENTNLIIHCTITGNGGTPIEPNVPNYEDSLKGLVNFVNLLGKERVVLRIDPIIPSSEYYKNSVDVFNKAKELLGENMCRVRISIYDNYKHSEKRMEECGVELKYKTFNIPLDIRKKILKVFENPEVCGESGIKSTPCLSEYDCKILGVDPGKPSGYQRKTCECLNNKYELLKRTGNQCAHKCAYCYLKGNLK